MNLFRKSLRARMIAMTIIPLVCVALIGLVTAVLVIGVLARRDARRSLAETIGEFRHYVADEESSMLQLVNATSGSRDVVFQAQSLAELAVSDPADLSKGVVIKIAKDLQSIYSGRGYSRVAFYYRGVLKSFITPDNVFIANGQGGFECPASPSAFVLYSAQTWRRVDVE